MVEENGNDAEEYINSVQKRVTEEAKGRRYISDPSDAPDDVDVQEGPQGGYYYETEGGGVSEEGGGPDEVWGSQYIVDEYGEDTFSSGSSAARAAMESLQMSPGSFWDPDSGKDNFDTAVDLAVAAQEQAGYDPERDVVENELAALAAAYGAEQNIEQGTIDEVVDELSGGDEGGEFSDIEDEYGEAFDLDISPNDDGTVTVEEGGDVRYTFADGEDGLEVVSSEVAVGDGEWTEQEGADVGMVEGNTARAAEAALDRVGGGEEGGAKDPADVDTSFDRPYDDVTQELADIVTDRIDFEDSDFDDVIDVATEVASEAGVDDPRVWADDIYQDIADNRSEEGGGGGGGQGWTVPELPWDNDTQQRIEGIASDVANEAEHGAYVYRDRQEVLDIAEEQARDYAQRNDLDEEIAVDEVREVVETELDERGVKSKSVPDTSDVVDEYFHE